MENERVEIRWDYFCKKRGVRVDEWIPGELIEVSPNGRMTRRLSESAKILGIALSDHVILGRRDADATGRGRFSFAEAGLL